MTLNQSSRIPSLLLLFVFIFLFVLSACNNNNKGYRFRGTLDPSDTGALYLVYDTFSIEDIPSPFDTAVINRGSFEFSGSVPNPMPCVLVWPNGDVVATFMLENSDIALDTGTNQFGRVVKGSASQRESEAVDELWSAYVNGLDTKLDSLSEVGGLPSKTRDSLQAESRKFDSIVEVAYYQKLAAYVKAHSTSYGVLYGWQMPELWEEGSIEPARHVLEQFDPSLRKSARGQALQEQIDYYQSLQAGQPAPELNLTDGDGKPVSLSTYKGKRIVLFTRPYWDLREDDYKSLSKLENTIIIANSPNESWSKLKHVKVYVDETTQSPYLPMSELAPDCFVIDETGLILSKGYDSWKSLK